MLKGKNNEVINRFVSIAFFYVLGHYRDGSGTGATGSAGSKQKGVRFKEPFRGSYRVNYLVTVFSGNFSTEFIYFAYTVATGLATTDEDSMLIILSDARQPTQVSRIRVYGIATGDYLNATRASCFLV